MGVHTAIFLTLGFKSLTTNHQLTTITFLQFDSVWQRWWAFRQMRSAHVLLASVPGLTFYKLLGSGGGNGFSIIPDLSTYAFLAVWQTRADAENFLRDHAVSAQTFTRTQHHWTIFLLPTQVKGSWGGTQPFPVTKTDISNGPVAVLTRATIHPRKLLSFWRQVPKVSNRLEHHQAGLLFSKGVGEVPLLQQATFSLWKSREAMVEYAYRSANHREMIKKTKALGWYKEELFAEFIPLETWGSWPTVEDLILCEENNVSIAE